MVKAMRNRGGITVKEQVLENLGVRDWGLVVKFGS
jgi:hypothetical protein